MGLRAGAAGTRIRRVPAGPRAAAGRGGCTVARNGK